MDKKERPSDLSSLPGRPFSRLAGFLRVCSYAWIRVLSDVPKPLATSRLGGDEGIKIARDSLAVVSRRPFRRDARWSDDPYLGLALLAGSTCYSFCLCGDFRQPSIHSDWAN